MAILRDRTDLDKKPTWYIFLAANVVMLLGCALTWILYTRDSVQYTVTLIPTLICNIVSIILCGIFLWLEAKGIMAKVAHFRKKWLYWYLAAMIVFIVAIIFNFVFTFIYNGWHPSHKEEDLAKILLITYFVITALLTLVSIGLQRYARFKIDLDIYRRTHGENPRQEEIKKQEPKVDSTTPQATSGLSETIEKQ